MTSELHHCRKSACWIPSLLDKGYHSLWPIMEFPERRSNLFVWTFYVKWTPTRGTRVNKALLCEKHHKQILRMFETDMASDLREMEVTQEWLIRVNSQMSSTTRS